MKPWLLCCFLLCSFAVAEPHRFRINLVITHDRSGYGDLASNLHMAQQLAEKYPQADITLIGNARDPKLQTLAGVDPKATLQYIGSLRFFDEKQAPPPADFVMGFSRLPDGFSAGDSRAPFHLSFSEYSGHREQPYQSKLPFYGFAQLAERPPGVRLDFATGASNMGFYVSARDPEYSSSRQNLMERVRKHAAGLPGYKDNQILAMAYSFHEMACLNYLKAVIKAADTPEYRDKEILVLVSHDFNPRDFQIPSNVKLVSYEGMPMDLHTELIQRSDLPPLVTGDASLTSALQAGKTFFYEPLHHKFGTADDLAAELTSRMRMAGFKNFMGDGLIYSNFETMVEVMRNPVLRQAVDDSVRRIRNGNSLVERLDPWLSVLSRMRPEVIPLLGWSDYQYLARVVREEESAEKVWARIQTDSTGPTYVSPMRLLAASDIPLTDTQEQFLDRMAIKRHPAVAGIDRILHYKPGLMARVTETLWAFARACRLVK